MNGIQAALEVLHAAGVTHLFGNPGTTELPLNAALVSDPRFQYVFGVHEIPVTSMADGFAMARQEIAFINLHTACGLGNAMGMLYNAMIERTPLVVTAGQQDHRLMVEEPVLYGDLVSIARPLVKYATEIRRAQDFPTLLRRAIQTALTPPTGPVFLSLPLDVQQGLVDGLHLDLSPPMIPDRRTRPSRARLEEAAELLAAARNPVILAGSRVMEAGAAVELTRLAETLGATVLAEGTVSHGRLPMSSAHPLYAGVMPYWAPDVEACLREYDCIFAVGMSVLRMYIHKPPENPLPPNASLIHLDNDPWEIGKNHPVSVGLPGDPKCGLDELADLVSARMSPTRKAESQRRLAAANSAKQAAQDKLRAEIAAGHNQRPLPPASFMGAMARVLPENIAVVEEAITSHQNVFERLGLLRDPSGFFAHRGWALGWGMGCTLGVKLAWPDRPVLGLIGDGSALYGIQALWSAAHHQIPVTYVIANNRQYKILKVCGEVMGLPELTDPRCPGIALHEPKADYVGLARSFGVEADHVSDPDELSERLAACLSSGKPHLLEVPVAA
jgi:benzoylformate decarboxylase